MHTHSRNPVKQDGYLFGVVDLTGKTVIDGGITGRTPSVPEGMTAHTHIVVLLSLWEPSSTEFITLSLTVATNPDPELNHILPSTFQPCFPPSGKFAGTHQNAPTSQKGPHFASGMTVLVLWTGAKVPMSFVKRETQTTAAQSSRSLLQSTSNPSAQEEGLRV